MFVFFFSLCKKKRDSACVCVWVLIKELLLMFAEVMIFFFEWVCSDDDFFLMGFFFLNGFALVMIFLIGGLDFKSAVSVSDHGSGSGCDGRCWLQLV